MSRMTCRNGFIFVAALCLGLMVTSACGGSPDVPAGPESTNSAMWTLNDIYNKLDTRAAVSKRTGAFTEPSGGPTNGTMHTLNEIMTLVTNRAPVQKTGQTTSYAVGDDGWYSTNVGVAWPNPRFTTNNIAAAGTNVVTDNLTGLMWTRNANLPDNTMYWTNAISYCTNMNSGVGTYGYTDWRLPNVRELLSLIDEGNSNPALPAGHPFMGVQNNAYWASTSYAILPLPNVWYVSLSDGTVYRVGKAETQMRVWPVRGRESR